jgi:hypothetical protein
VVEITTDAHGQFSITIPYFSKYFIQVVDESGEIYKASLEIQKHKAEANEHEIVIIKDAFGVNGQ